MPKLFILLIVLHLIYTPVSAQTETPITLDTVDQLTLFSTLSTERPWVNDLEFSFDDTMLAVVETGHPDQHFADVQGLVRIWDTASWEQSLLIAHEDKSATTVGFNHTGAFVAIGTTTGEIYRWVLVDNVFSDSFTTHSSMITKINTYSGQAVFSGSGQMSPEGILEHGRSDTRPFFSNETTVRTLITERDGMGVISWVDANSMHAMYVTGTLTQATVYLWYTESGQITARLPGYGPAKPILYTPGGNNIIYGSISGVLVWGDLIGLVGDPDRILEARVIAPVGLDRMITEIALNPTGDVLAVGYDNGDIRLWALESGEFLHQITGHTGAISRLVFNKSGTLLASGGADGAVRVWGIASNEE